MGGYPRYCVQCGGGLTPDTRFCSQCGQPTAPADAEASGPWRDASPAGFAPPTGPAYPPPPRTAEPVAELSPPPSSVLPPTEAVPSPAETAPPLSGPAYPAAPMYSPAERPSPPPPRPPPGRPMPPAQDRAGSGPRPAYPPAQDRAGSGPRPAYPPAQDRAGSGPRPAYPATPAPYALPSGSAATSPPPAVPGPGGETAKFGTSWMDQVGFNPQWEQAPAGSQWPPGPPARTAVAASPALRASDAQPRKRQLLSIGLFAVIAAVLVVPAFLIVHALHGLGGSSAAAAEPTTKPTASAAAAATERSAAASLATLLGQSVTDRDTIVSAVGAVNRCTSAVSQAPAQFQEGATSRQKLLKQLASMPGRSKLPAAMLSQLTTAWQASATVDTDLSKWARDEVSSGCHAHNDANLAAADGPDVQASNAKSAFVALWNPIAAQYGLTKYSTGQL